MLDRVWYAAVWFANVGTGESLYFTPNFRLPGFDAGVGSRVDWAQGRPAHFTIGGKHNGPEKYRHS